MSPRGEPLRGTGSWCCRRLRASDRAEEQVDAHRGGHLGGLPGNIGAAIVGEPLQAMRDPKGREAELDGRDHKIRHHLAGDAGIGDVRPSDNLPVTGVDHEDDAHHLVIAGMDLQMIGAPADAGAQGNNDAIVGHCLTGDDRQRGQLQSPRRP